MQSAVETGRRQRDCSQQKKLIRERETMRYVPGTVLVGVVPRALGKTGLILKRGRIGCKEVCGKQ